MTTLVRVDAGIGGESRGHGAGDGLEYGWFRGVYQDLMAGTARTGAGLAAGLAARTGRAAGQLAGLAPLRHREPRRARRLSLNRRAPAGREHLQRLHELYALSRISDYLLELGRPRDGTGRGSGRAGARTARPVLDLHAGFLGDIGLERFEEAGRDAAFSPFHHEIVAVVPDETRTAVAVDEVIWPGFRFGDLLFCRAGVRVRAPAALVDPEVATTSTLYFTHRRAPRRTHDTAAGWGSNSQWRTSFDRFYADAAGFHLNWDGDVDIGRDPPAPRPGTADPYADGPLERRREVLLHRCLVRAPLPADDGDWYPYADRLSVRRSTWPPDPGDILAGVR